MSDKVEKIKYVSIYSFTQSTFVCEHFTVEKYQSFHEEYMSFIKDNLVSKQLAEHASVYGNWITKYEEQFIYIGNLLISTHQSNIL